MNLVIVNGFPLSGKDTFVDFCVWKLASIGIDGFSVSSVGAVKDAALLLGWDGEKDERGRQFLSDLKDMSTTDYDGPMRYMERMIEQECISFRKKVVFLHIREPEEITKFVTKYPETETVFESNG